MKRITKVLSVIICLMMVIGLVIPMGGFASATGTIGRRDVTLAQLEEILTTGKLSDDILVNGNILTFVPGSGETPPFNIDTSSAERLEVLGIGTASGVFTLDLNNHILNLNSTSGNVLELDGTTLNVQGAGTLNIINTGTTNPADRNGIVMSGTSGFIRIAGAATPNINISAVGAPISISNNSNATLTNVTGGITTVGSGTTRSGSIKVGTNSVVIITGDIGPSGQGLVVNGASDVTVVGNISGGVTATAGADVNITGNVIGGVIANTGAEVDITGNISGVTPAISANGTNTIVTVNGNVSGGVTATADADVEIEGNITVTGNDVAGISSDKAVVKLTGNISVTGNNTAGVHAWNGANVTVTGNISASGATGTSTNTGVILGAASPLPVGSNTVRVNGSITATRYIFFQTHDNTTTALRFEGTWDNVVVRDTVTYLQYNGTPGTVEVQVAAGTVSAVTGNGTINIPFERDGNTIKLDLDGLIDGLIGTATGTNPVRIDFSSVPSTTVSISQDLFKKVHDANKTLRLDFPEGRITLSAGALSTLAGQTGTGNINLSLHRQNVSTLPPAQRNVINESTDDTYRVTAAQGGTSITSFGGTLTIIFNYAGPFPARVYHIDGTGDMTHLATISTQNPITFTIDKLSIFIIRHASDNSGDTTGPNDPNVPKTSDDVNILMLGIVALVAVGGLIIMVVVKKRYITGNSK